MKITMAHGSGGKTSAQLMEEIFGKYFSNTILDKMEDGAVFDLSGKLAMSTDSFVVNPLVFKGGNIGKLSICGTINDLLMMGAKPKYLSCGFILEEGLSIDLLSEIVRTMADQVKVAGVSIVAGDTKVIEGNGGMYINTTGIGLVPMGRDISASNCQVGDQIILSGTLGEHHSCILSSRMNIQNQIHSDCSNLSDITESLFQGNIKVRAMRDVTRGGLATILNEIAGTSNCKIQIIEDKIPVSQEVKSFASILGLDPLYMGNEGKMIAIVAKEDAKRALELVRNTSNGKQGAIIGEVLEGKGTYLTTTLGGTRVLDMLYGEGLPRIC